MSAEIRSQTVGTGPIGMGLATCESVMNRLREGTAEAHKHAESRPLEASLFRGTLPRSAFVEFLGQRHCVHRTLEAAVRALARADARAASVLREELFQTSNLESDLRYFGVRDGEIRPFAATTTYETVLRNAGERADAALVGHYYVFEGSKNGAKILSRTVARAYGLTGRDGLTYLDPHGDGQRTVWAEFKTAVDRAGFTNDEADRMVAGARQAFAAVAEIDDAIWERFGGCELAKT